jgi:hypothetical protein
MYDVFITPLRRRHVVVVPEIAVESGDGKKTAFLGNLRNGSGGGLKKIHRPLDPVPVQVFQRSDSHELYEYFPEMAFAHRAGPGHLHNFEIVTVKFIR